MKTLIIYDSVFGNTAKIAHAIFQGCSMNVSVNTKRVQDINTENLQGIELLIVGSPTRGFRPTPAVSNFIKRISANSLKGMKVAAFDTRLPLNHCDSGFVRFIVRKGGYAADVILKQLIKKGGTATTKGEGFFVTGEDGPLLESELERAAQWTRSLS